MKIRNSKLAALSAAMILGSLAGSSAFAASDTLWDEFFLKGMQRLEMMKMMDANHDHKVTREEFMHHTEMTFAAMDRNSDGYIDEDEWTKLIRLTNQK